MTMQPHRFNNPRQNPREVRQTLRNAMHGKPCPRCYTPMRTAGKKFACVNPVCSRYDVEVKP